MQWFLHIEIHPQIFQVKKKAALRDTRSSRVFRACFDVALKCSGITATDSNSQYYDFGDSNIYPTEKDIL